MWDLKKIPRKRWTWHFCFEIIKNRPAFTSTQSASPQDWVWNCIYVSLFIHSFTYSYFWKNRPAFTSTQSASPQHWTLNWYLNVYFDCYFFLSINLIHIKHRHDISVLKSFNNSPACIYFHSKCLTARLIFELYLCFFIYSFIHSLIHIFFTIIYLFHFI